MGFMKMKGKVPASRSSRRVAAPITRKAIEIVAPRNGRGDQVKDLGDLFIGLVDARYPGDEPCDRRQRRHPPKPFAASELTDEVTDQP